METSIRYVRIMRSSSDDDGSNSVIKPALCFRGKRAAHAVVNDETCVHVVSVPLASHDASPPVLFKRLEYPLPKFIAHIERIGKSKGITQRARYFLDRAVNHEPIEESELPPDVIGTMIPEVHAESLRPVPNEPRQPAAKAVGGTLIARIAADVGLEPPKLRKLLRAAGMRAPYEDEKAIRAAIKKGSK